MQYTVYAPVDDRSYCPDFIHFCLATKHKIHKACDLTYTVEDLTQ